MRINHRRKREHKAKVRRHAWKRKYDTRCRRFYKAFAEGFAHLKYRTLAMAVGEMHAKNTHQRLMFLLAGSFDRRSLMYRKACREAFLYGYAHVMNDRRYDKEFHGETLDRNAARAADYALWNSKFFNEEVTGVIHLKPGEDVKMLKPGEHFHRHIDTVTIRPDKGSLWQRAKAKLVGWFGGNSLQKQSL